MGSAATVATAVSVGYVIWTLRGGYLVASLLSSLPAWRLIDPLPILDGFDGKSNKGDDETLESMIDRAEERFHRNVTSNSASLTLTH